MNRLCFVFLLVVSVVFAQVSSGSSGSSSGWTSSGSTSGGTRCGASYCAPNTKCANCVDGSQGCFDWNMYGSCCSCRPGSACWACPRASQCNLYKPNWCNSTCATNNRCQFGYNCQICLDGQEACFPSSQPGVCCGCVNGRCWQCKYQYQCSANNPGYCLALKREATNAAGDDYELAENEWEQPLFTGSPSSHL